MMTTETRGPYVTIAGLLAHLGHHTAANPHRARPQEEAMSTTTRRLATASVLGDAVTKARTTPDFAITGEVITGAAA
jgi:hypothetical protein